MSETRPTFSPQEVLSHLRNVNRRFDTSNEAAAFRLEACLTEQLKELGLVHRYQVESRQEEIETRTFDYIDPMAVGVIINAFMSGKLPQPDDESSFLYTEKTAIGRQAALDTALERIKMSETYDISTDPDFYPPEEPTDG